MEMQDYSTAVATGEEDQGDLSLDVIPDSSSAGVREWLKRLPQLFMARQILLTLGVVGRYQYVAANASAKEASVLVKTQDGLFNVLKSIDATSLMLQSFQSGANNILEKLKVAYLYLLDGFPDFAKTDIDAIAKDIKTMKESTEKPLWSMKKTTESIEEAHRLVSAKTIDHKGQLAAIPESVDQLNEQYRILSGEMMSGSDRQTSIDHKESELEPSPTFSFLVIMKINTIAFLNDPVSLLIIVFFSFFVSNCYFKNYINCLLATMIMVFGMTSFLLVKLWRVKNKPVIVLSLLASLLAIISSYWWNSYSCYIMGAYLMVVLPVLILSGREVLSVFFLILISSLAQLVLLILIGIIVTFAVVISVWIPGRTYCDIDSSICGWVTLSFGVTLFLLRFALLKYMCPKHVDYKPVIPLILLEVIICFVLFPCQEKREQDIMFLWDPLPGNDGGEPMLMYFIDSDSFLSIRVLIFIMTQLLLMFALWKSVQPIRMVVPPTHKVFLFILVLGIKLYLIPLALFLLPCESKCIMVLMLVPPSTVFMLLLWYDFAPDHWLSKVPKNQSKVSYNSVNTQDSTESLQEQRERIRQELLEKSAEKQRIEASIGDADLTKCFLSKALSDLKSVTGIIQQSTAVIEKWYKECKDVIEPSMGRTIQRAQAVPEEELGEYWNSMAFKKEVVGYYCRWRALQVYCETLRSECREKRATLESHYVENLYPREAVKKAWELANEEAGDLEVAELIRRQKERMNGHDLIHRVNNRSRELKLDISQ